MSVSRTVSVWRPHVFVFMITPNVLAAFAANVYDRAGGQRQFNANTPLDGQSAASLDVCGHYSNRDARASADELRCNCN